MMVILKNNVEIFDHHGFIQSYLKCKEPDCILYSEEGMKFKVHKEIFYFSKLCELVHVQGKGQQMLCSKVTECKKNL